MCVSFQLLWVYRPPTPFCLKLCFTPVNFYKRPPLVSAFSNWKTLGEELLFLEKVKSEVLSMCLAASCLAGSGHPGSERGRPAGSAPPRLTVRPPRLGTVSEHLGLISVYFVHLRAGRVPSSSIVHLAAFQFMRGFLGTLYFRIVRELCVSRSGSYGLCGGSLFGHMVL